ncbi:carbohydrate ABC transporter permease [Paenibacillus sp. CGMCC 1.16610]|uniref:ABC transporter permease subunit n=1 Tax=Paenibacillus anseongense TaxID=2682845 RepID=A0ABW9UA96_9BACL|nr:MULTISPECIES: carbohydrate ABC transporter permease [Paenibacillus]MBA2937313.1 carbohydrate ABC transporter permease [Paenibacillus sp. CGMCC 1.16610]MVQ36371.1 ABC transporter permease subunit [Paenibacillus anseongense]
MKIFKWLFIGLLTVVSLFPFYVMVMMSTYYSEDIFKQLPLLPSSYAFNNLETVFKTNFLKVYANSLIVSLASVLLGVFTSTLIGYAIAKFHFKLRRILTYFIIITMMVPAQVGLIGYIIEMRHMGFGNTLMPVILTWSAWSFGAFFMIQFIRDTVPSEIIECARIDGASEPGILFRIVLQLIKPGISTLSTLVFLWSWNNYLLPLVTINNSKWFTLPVFISTLGIVHRTDYGARMAALCIATLPVLLIFLLGSRTFIKGLTAGAVKG